MLKESSCTLANRVSNVANTYKGVGASKMHKVTLTRLALTTEKEKIKGNKCPNHSVSFENIFFLYFKTNNLDDY